MSQKELPCNKKTSLRLSSYAVFLGDGCLVFRLDGLLLDVAFLIRVLVEFLVFVLNRSWVVGPLSGDVVRAEAAKGREAVLGGSCLLEFGPQTTVVGGRRREFIPDTHAS